MTRHSCSDLQDSNSPCRRGIQDKTVIASLIQKATNPGADEDLLQQPQVRAGSLGRVVATLFLRHRLSAILSPGAKS